MRNKKVSMEKIEIFAGSTLYTASKWLEEMAGKIVINQRIFDPSSQQLMIFYEPVPKARLKSFSSSRQSEGEINAWLQKEENSARIRGGYFRVTQSLLVVTHNADFSESITNLYYETDTVEE